MYKSIFCIIILLSATTFLCCHAFTPSSSLCTNTQLPYTSSSSSNIDDTTTTTTTTTTSFDADGQTTKKKPNWVPMELVELASEDLQMSQEEFIQHYADIEAYTSCDDEGDDFHECDFFKHYLGPTKWVHLTPEAKQEINDLHFSIWQDVWMYPHEAVDIADKVSKECLRYYKEFMLEPRTSSVKCPTDRPLVKIKVVPASFGLEGFEDAVWEATEDLLAISSNAKNHAPEDHSNSVDDDEDDYCKAITFVVAAPDLFTDPALLEGVPRALSPQAEFEPDKFQAFSSTLRGKMSMFSQVEGMPLNDTIELEAFHPLYRSDMKLRTSSRPFPYPCISVSTKIEDK